MSHSPGPGMVYKGNGIWGPALPLQQINANSPLVLGDSEGFLLERELGTAVPPIITEVDILKEEIKKLTSRIEEQELTLAKQIDCINHLYSLIEELQQNLAGQRKRQAAHYWQEA